MVSNLCVFLWFPASLGSLICEDNHSLLPYLVMNTSLNTDWYINDYCSRSGADGSGLYFESARRYEGYFFAAGRNNDSATVHISLRNRYTSSTLGNVSIRIEAGDVLKQYFFSIQTNGNAPCDGVIRCAGELRVGVEGSVNIDFVYLQPGSWGRFKGLPVLKTGADLLLKMGIKAIRQVCTCQNAKCNCCARQQCIIRS